MPVYKVVNTATQSSVSLRWRWGSRARKREMLPWFPKLVADGVNGVMSSIEQRGGHKKASFVAVFKQDGKGHDITEIRRKSWRLFRSKDKEQVLRNAPIDRQLLAFWNRLNFF